MAYDIISASSSDGSAVSVPIEWGIDNPSSDLTVFVSTDAGLSKSDSWVFDSANSAVKVANPSGTPYSVYVFRSESAAMLAQLVASGEVLVSDIIAQLQKNVRVLEQLERVAECGLRSVDKISPLPAKGQRAGKFLGFDENGNPVCEIEMTAFADARAEVAQAKADAAKSADAAAKSAGAAETSAELAGRHEGNASEYASNAESAKDAAESAKAAAKASAESAATSDANATSAAETANSCKQVSEAAKTAAAQSATDAQSSANASESSAQSAEASAGLAAQNASDAEDAKDAAVAAKNTANSAAGLASDSADNAELAAQQAQQAAAQAVEITDPEGWRTDTRAMIARLALTKSDSGTLYFSGGSASATPNLAFDTLSVLFKTDFDFSVAQTANVLFPFLAGTMSTGIYLAAQFGGDNRLRAMMGATAIGSFSRSDIAALVGDGLNALAFVFKKLADGNAQVSLFVNGVSVQNHATATAVYPTLNNALSVNKWGSSSTSAGTVGYSDFRVLNFDVSATDAPYSLSDYQAGKRLPPFLSGGVYIKSNPDVVAQAAPSAGNLGQTTQGTLAKSDDGYTLTLTSAATRRFWFKLDKKYPAGTWFRVRRGALTWDGMETTGSRISQTSLNVGTSTTSPYTTPVNNLPTSEAADVVFQTPVEADLIGFPLWNGADVPTATISIPYFEFAVIGANVALENYTFDGKICDASGNESHATISGSVAGDMDNSVNQIYSAFSAKYTQENA